MVSEAQVRAKTDSELLEIWTNQKDYIIEMVTRVKTEIERRNLDTTGIHVITVEEVEKKKAAAQALSEFKQARGAAVFQGALGLFMLWLFFDTFSSDEPLVVPISLIVAALLQIFFAVGVWRRKRWAFTSGVVLYTLITAFNLVGTIVTALDVSGDLKPANAAGTFLFQKPDMVDVLEYVVATFLCGSLALIFNSLRKRSRVRAIRSSEEARA
ncbi:MAG: hypothetical protein WA871_11495 [Candidatus Acidiferrales bacterium]